MTDDHDCRPSGIGGPDHCGLCGRTYSAEELELVEPIRQPAPCGNADPSCPRPESCDDCLPRDRRSVASRILARCDPAWYGLRDDPPRLFAAARAMVELCAASQRPGPDGRMVDVEPILPSRLLAVAAEELGIAGQALRGLVAEFIGEHDETLRRLED